LTACTRKVPSLSGERDLEQPHSPSSGGALRYHGGVTQGAREKPRLAAAARRWLTPFRASFPDVRMEIVELVAGGDKVVGRFTCSTTHQGKWLGQAPTGRRFDRIDEVWILQLRDGKIVHVWSLEDTLGRLRQLGLTAPHD
jgi:predicted ester cyclase